MARRWVKIVGELEELEKRSSEFEWEFLKSDQQEWYMHFGIDYNAFDIMDRIDGIPLQMLLHEEMAREGLLQQQAQAAQQQDEEPPQEDAP